jgi:MOSC domain-containing protein YiiM
MGPVGFAEDQQADLHNHGGADKAVCAYCADHYDAWRATLPIGPADYGAFGENLSLTGLDEHGACIGDVWTLGDAVLEVSQPRQPCWKLGRRWRMPSLPDEVVRTGWTGWYFRVLRAGTVAAGMPLGLTQRPHPAWTIAAANDVMHRHVGETAALVAVPALSASWRRTLERRLSP